MDTKPKCYHCGLERSTNKPLCQPCFKELKPRIKAGETRYYIARDEKLEELLGRAPIIDFTGDKFQVNVKDELTGFMRKETVKAPILLSRILTMFMTVAYDSGVGLTSAEVGDLLGDRYRYMKRMYQIINKSWIIPIGYRMGDQGKLHIVYSPHVYSNMRVNNRKPRR